jgi:hypothetical protein
MALHFAAMNGSVEVVNALILASADSTVDASIKTQNTDKVLRMQRL